MDNRAPQQHRGLTFEEQVALERLRQDNKWGEQNHLPEQWLVILMEELGELSKALLEEEIFCHTYPTDNPRRIENELIHITAVAKAMWESGKRDGWL